MLCVEYCCNCRLAGSSLPRYSTAEPVHYHEMTVGSDDVDTPGTRRRKRQMAKISLLFLLLLVVNRSNRSCSSCQMSSLIATRFSVAWSVCLSSVTLVPLCLNHSACQLAGCTIVGSSDALGQMGRGAGEGEICGVKPCAKTHSCKLQQNRYRQSCAATRRIQTRNNSTFWMTLLTGVPTGQ